MEATVPTHLPRKLGPKDLNDFLKNFQFENVWEIWACGVIAVVWLVVLAGLTIGWLWGVVLGWAALSMVPFGVYAASCSDYSMTLVWLPWRQRWTWAFVLFTLPWLPFWLISAVRLAATRKVPRED
jgi:hypothetical protein